MQFKIDENLPADVAILLRQVGYDAMTVFEQQLVGSADPLIAAVCKNETRILITLDIDFADIRAYPPSQHPGIIVLRLQRQDKPNILSVMEQVVRLLSFEPANERLWIVEEHRIRIRE